MDIIWQYIQKNPRLLILFIYLAICFRTILMNALMISFVCLINIVILLSFTSKKLAIRYLNFFAKIPESIIEKTSFKLWKFINKYQKSLTGIFPEPIKTLFESLEKYNFVQWWNKYGIASKGIIKGMKEGRSQKMDEGTFSGRKISFTGLLCMWIVSFPFFILMSLPTIIFILLLSWVFIR